MHRHKRTLPTRTQSVNRPGYQFFSRTALPLDQDVGPRVRHLPHLVQHFLHGRGNTENFFQTVRPVQLLP